jgi:hypothetical protein
MPDQPQPIFAADDPDLPDLPDPQRLTPGRFVRTLLLGCVLYFLLVVAAAGVGAGWLALFVTLAPAIWAAGRLTGVRGIGTRLLLGLLTFVIVNVTTYVILVVWLASYTAPVGG